MFIITFDPHIKSVKKTRSFLYPFYNEKVKAKIICSRFILNKWQSELIHFLTPKSILSLLKFIFHLQWTYILY